MNQPYLDVQHYSEISNYTINYQVVTGAVLEDLKQDMGFDQFRFYCFKKVVGRVFHVKTALNELGKAVVSSHTHPSFNKFDLASMPKACGSFVTLSGDTSALSGDCQAWGWTKHGTYEKNRWGALVAHGKRRMFSYLAGIRREFSVRMQTYGKNDVKYSCDDSDSAPPSTLSKGDEWKVFVR